MTVEAPETEVGKDLCISFPEGLILSDGNRIQRCYRLLEKAQIEYGLKTKAMEVIQKYEKGAVDHLVTLDLEGAVLGELRELLDA